MWRCDCVTVCGDNPCSEGLLSHVQCLVTVPNLQAGAHGILDPPCATKLRSWIGYQGWSPWRTCSWSQCSFIIQAFWWLSGYYFVICMNNSRNRSPLRIFQYLPMSATFIQCGQRQPSWTMHVNSIISSGTLSGMKRLIDEIRSFKCVCAPVSRHSLCVFVAGCTWYECSSECHLSTVYSAVCLSGIMKNQIISHVVKPLITTRNSKFIVVLILNQITSLCWSASISNEKLTWKQVDENGEKIPLKPIP